jgi:hypothetical protein
MDPFPAAPDPELEGYIDPALLQVPPAEPLAPFMWPRGSQTILSDDLDSGGSGLGSALNFPQPLLSLAFPVLSAPHSGVCLLTRDIIG